MKLTPEQTVPPLSGLPVSLPREGAVGLEIEQGVLVLRVSAAVQERVESLVEKEREAGLTADEARELAQYEEIDDYLSFLNRLTRNLTRAQGPPLAA